MTIKTIIAGSASAVVLLTQTAIAGSLAPVVDCDVTPDAPECAVVTLSPADGAGSLGGLGAAGTAAAVGGGLLALGAIAALVDDDDDDDSDATTTTGEED